MRSPIRLALSAAILLLLAGCNQAASHDSGGGGGATPGPISAPPAPPSTDAAGCPTSLTVTSADGGRTVCVAVGGTVTVTTPTNQVGQWVGFDSSGAALAPLTATPAAGPDTTVLGAYRAVTAGTATLESSRRACPPQSGAVSCHALTRWTVTVQVK